MAREGKEGKRRRQRARRQNISGSTAARRAAAAPIASFRRQIVVCSLLSLAGISSGLRLQRRYDEHEIARIAARDVPHGVEGKGRRKRSGEFLDEAREKREKERERESKSEEGEEREQKNGEKKLFIFFSASFSFFFFPLSSFSNAMDIRAKQTGRLSLL